MLFLQCESGKQELKNQRAEFAYMTADYETEISKNGLEISTQKLIITSDKKTLVRMAKKYNQLHAIKTQVKTKVIVSIPKTKAIPLEPIKIVEIEKSEHVLRLPQSYGVEDNYYSIYYTVNIDGNSYIDSASFTIEPTITIGYLDKGIIKNIFSKKELYVLFETNNPYSKTVNMSNINYKPSKKWYERKGLYYIGGLITGIIIVK